MKTFSSLCAAALLLAACEQNAGKTNEDAKNFDSARKVPSTDSIVTPAPPLTTASYAGSLPCADCEAIGVTIDLLGDSSFRKKVVYMGRKEANNEKTDTGRFAWKGDTLVLQVNNEPGQYVKTDSGLVQLDMKGKRITGKLADKYVLKQTQ